jgi:hypothetical protein
MRRQRMWPRYTGKASIGYRSLHLLTARHGITTSRARIDTTPTHIPSPLGRYSLGFHILSNTPLKIDSDVLLFLERHYMLTML